MLRAKEPGEEAYKAFREQLLECDLPNVELHDTKNKWIAESRNFQMSEVHSSPILSNRSHGHWLSQMARCTIRMKPTYHPEWLTSDCSRLISGRNGHQVTVACSEINVCCSNNCVQ